MRKYNSKNVIIMLMGVIVVGLIGLFATNMINFNNNDNNSGGSVQNNNDGDSNVEYTDYTEEYDE